VSDRQTLRRSRAGKVARPSQSQLLSRKSCSCSIRRGMIRARARLRLGTQRRIALAACTPALKIARCTGWPTSPYRRGGNLRLCAAVILVGISFRVSVSVRHLATGTKFRGTFSSAKVARPRPILSSFFSGTDQFDDPELRLLLRSWRAARVAINDGTALPCPGRGKKSGPSSSIGSSERARAE